MAKYKFSNGAEYIGDMQNGLPHGSGVCYWTDGSFYSGKWANGQPHGFGQTSFGDGHIIHGMWNNGRIIQKYEGPYKPGQNIPEVPTTNNKNLALVVGNCDYHRNHKLKNCINDARAFSTELSKLGFDVITLEDGKKAQIDEAVDQLCSKACYYDNVLFFYSGHGLEYAGVNYLVPIDDDRSIDDDDINSYFNNVDEIIEQLKNCGAKLKIIILDACRSNPFRDVIYRNFGSNGVKGGAAQGLFIAYATSKNEVSLDFVGDSEHSPYMEAILSNLSTPNLSIFDLFGNVSQMVQQVTLGRQLPWISCNLTGDFYFNPKI